MRFLIILILGTVFADSAQAISIPEIAQSILEKMDEQLTYQAGPPKLTELPPDLQRARKVSQNVGGFILLWKCLNLESWQKDPLATSLELITSLLNIYRVDRTVTSLTTGRVPKYSLLITEAALETALMRPIVQPEDYWGAKAILGIFNVAWKSLEYSFLKKVGAYLKDQTFDSKFAYIHTHIVPFLVLSDSSIIYAIYRGAGMYASYRIDKMIAEKPGVDEQSAMEIPEPVQEDTSPATSEKMKEEPAYPVDASGQENLPLSLQTACKLFRVLAGIEIAAIIIHLRNKEDHPLGKIEYVGSYMVARYLLDQINIILSTGKLPKKGLIQSFYFITGLILLASSDPLATLVGSKLPEYYFLHRLESKIRKPLGDEPESALRLRMRLWYKYLIMPLRSIIAVRSMVQEYNDPFSAAKVETITDSLMWLLLHYIYYQADRLTSLRSTAKPTESTVS